MTQTTNKPFPKIDLEKCDGCGLCVRSCQNKVFAIRNGKAEVVSPQACDYRGLCETVCPRQAVSRLFEIVVLADGQEETLKKSTKVVENE